MDRRARQAMVHMVVKSQTWLKQLSMKAVQICVVQGSIVYLSTCILLFLILWLMQMCSLVLRRLAGSSADIQGRLLLFLSSRSISLSALLSPQWHSALWTATTLASQLHPQGDHGAPPRFPLLNSGLKAPPHMSLWAPLSCFLFL